MQALYAKFCWALHFVCHQRPERSFHSFGIQWPVCARCSGVVLGVILITAISIWFIKRNIDIWNRASLRLLYSILMLPLIIDGFYGLSNDFQTSGNVIRFVTGLIFSIGAISLLVSLIPRLERCLT